MIRHTRYRVPPSEDSPISCLDIGQPLIDRLRRDGILTVKQLKRDNLSRYTLFECHAIRKALADFRPPKLPPSAA
jgi:hypothetical protein